MLDDSNYACYDSIARTYTVTTSDPNLVGLRKGLIFNVYLNEYRETTHTSYVIVVSFLECPVDEGTIALPKYQDQVYSLDLNQKDIQIPFLLFKSEDAESCSFSFQYRVSLDKTFNYLNYPLSEYVILDLVTTNSIIISAPTDAIAQATIVTVTGSLTT